MSYQNSLQILFNNILETGSTPSQWGETGINLINKMDENISNVDLEKVFRKLDRKKIWAMH